MNGFKKVLSFILALSLVMSLCVPAFAEVTGEKTIQVISINDFHGALAGGSKDLGYAKLVAAVNEAKLANPNTLVVSGGDNYQGSAMSNMTKGEPVSEMLKALGTAASAIGNHEFDWGTTNFEKWSTDGGFDFLASNIYDKTTGNPVTWAKPYKIVVVDGVKVGLIGLATPETLTKTKAEHVANLEFRDAAVAAQEWIDFLKAGKAAEGTPTVIIALTHLGTKQATDGTITGIDVENLCKNTTGLNGVVTAHSHQKVAGTINGVAVVQAMYQGRALGFLDIIINADGTVKSVTPSVKDFNAYKELVADPTAKTAFDKWNTTLSPILDEILGVASGDFTHDNKTNVSILGSWVCETMAAKTGAKVAFQNGGGLRVPVPAGNITYGLMYQVMPFDNTLVTMDLTGADILKAVEHGIDLPTAGFGSFSGLLVQYDPAREYGSKVTSMKFSDGSEVDLAARYKVVVNDFMSTGGDGYDFKGAINVVDTFIPIRDLLVDTVKSEKTIAPEAVSYVTVASVVVVPEPQINEVIYIVKPGDVLWKIAKTYGLTYQEIGEYNKLKNVNLIIVNQKLLIPTKE